MGEPKEPVMVDGFNKYMDEYTKKINDLLDKKFGHVIKGIDGLSELILTLVGKIKELEAKIK